MPAPQPPVPETLEELNARIDLIELRVVRRDMEFRHHSESLKARGQALLEPSRWLRPALGLGSGWLFWRLVRRRPHRGRHDRHAEPGRRPGVGALLSGLLGSVLGAKAAEAHGGAHGGAHSAGAQAHGAPAAHDGKHKPELAMLQMLTMAWGFMPARIRGSLGPDTTQLLLGLVAGLMQGMQRKRKEKADAAVAAPPTAAPATSASAPASTVRPAATPSVPGGSTGPLPSHSGPIRAR